MPPRRHSRTRGVRTYGTGHSAAVPVTNPEALTVKRQPTPPPGNQSIGFDQRVRQGRDTTAAVIGLMDQLASDLGLTVRESHSTRTYRYGSRGPAVWLEPTQGRLVIDLRTLALRFPTADVPTLHTTISRLFEMSNVSDQPGIRISTRVVGRWDALRAEVLEPFFRASKPDL
jgi:hypothetical protein